MARSIDPLVVGRVIGDVLDMFVPTAELVVKYGDKQVANGCEIKPSIVAQRPHVHIPGFIALDSLYTLVCDSLLFHPFIRFMDFGYDNNITLWNIYVMLFGE